MPSASLQSRINAFESLQSGNNHNEPKLNGGVRLAPLNLSPKPRLQQQHFLDFDSTSPTADALCSIPPIQPDLASSRPSSPAALGRKSSLIDFSELASPKDNPVSVDRTGSTTCSTSTSDSKKPSLPPRNLQIPPLPPRLPSTPPIGIRPHLPKRHASSPVSVPESKPPSSTLLLNAPDSHTYPPGLPRRGTSPVFQSRHMPSSSTSSFHSVSLSSDGGDTRESLDGSYEAVSSTAATSPTISTQYDWEHDSKFTPKLPQRQWQKQTISAPTSPIASSSPTTIRRPPPPPPPRGSVKPQSQQHRPAPLSPNVRKRYDALFERNLPQSPRKSRGSGWRGLSVDLLTNGDQSDFMDDSSREERLDGRVIRCIWCCSKLPRARLREIW